MTGTSPSSTPYLHEQQLEGRRIYNGHPIPDNAPPHPDDHSLWNDHLQCREPELRVKSRRICVRIPWALPERCPASARPPPGESDKNPTGIRYKAQGNPTTWNLELATYISAC